MVSQRPFEDHMRPWAPSRGSGNAGGDNPNCDTNSGRKACRVVHDPVQFGTSLRSMQEMERSRSHPSETDDDANKSA